MGNINDMQDVFDEIISTTLYNNADDNTKKTTYKNKEIFINLEIKKTSKVGMDQINEDICK